MKLLQELSAHRAGGWQGQYNRMIRWSNRFIDISGLSDDEYKTHQYFDFLYSAFQNIFFLKDWLRQDSTLSNSELNQFINDNWEIGLCRDICNGTKHFDINHPSVDSEFAIIREYNPFHKVLNQSSYKIIILADGDKIEPYILLKRCIELWDEFIETKLNMELRKTKWE